MANILFVSKPVAPPWNDSSKNLVRDIAGGLQRHHAIVLAGGGAESLGARVRVEAVYRTRPSRYAPSLWSNALVMGRLVTGRRHDLWHFFFAPNRRSAWAASAAARRRDVPTLQTVCSAPAIGSDWQRLLFADCTVVLSQHTEQRLLGEGVPPERLQRIPPAVAPLPVPDPTIHAATRLSFGLPTGAPLIVYPGDLEFGRGATRAIELIADLPAHLGVQLAMACRPKTVRARREERRLRELATRLGCAVSVHWIGETPQIHALLACADVVMLPSESLYAKMDLPLVLIEAMYLERAVVVAEGTAAAELGEGGGARRVALDRTALSESVRVLLEDGPQRLALGRQARQEALRRFEPATVVEAYEQLYDELVDS